MSNKLDLDLTKNKKVIMSNDAITGKQAMDLREAKLLRLLIMQINMKDKNLMEYKASIKEIADCLEVDGSNLYRDIQKICDSLTTRRLGIKTDDPKKQWKFYPWMSMAEYDGAGTLILGLNEKIRPFVIGLNTLFTQYEMIDILKINSFYALRIYELLKMEFTKFLKKKHAFEFTIQELREITDTEEKFKQIGSFRRNVIDIAEREINEKTDISIKVEEIKKSRKYIGFRFIVTEEKSIQALDLEPETSADPVLDKGNITDIARIREILSSNNIPCSIKQAKQLFLAYDSEIGERFLDNLAYILKRKDVKNRVAYLLKIAKDHVAKEPGIVPADPADKKKYKPRNNKIDPIETMSNSRKQAYIDMEVEFAEDLWPELSVSENPNVETIVAIQEIEEMESNSEKPPFLKNI